MTQYRQHKETKKRVLKCPHLSMTKVEVTYEDHTVEMMTVTEFNKLIEIMEVKDD